MASIKNLVENKATLNYEELCKALIEQFAVKEKVNWESLLPPAQQQELFGGETLRLVADHPKFTNQKDIRPIALMKGGISQLLFFFVRLNDEALTKNQIQKVTTRFIRGSEANRYIIWFFGNKKETELKVVLSGKEGKKVVLKTLPFGINQPYYKTYDFILSEVRTKVHSLFVEPTDLWKALWNAFDISIINRNFYNEIKAAFEKLLTQLNRKGNPFKNDEDRVQFAIRLIGRIIFCWFLKRKEVLKDDAISSLAVKGYEQKSYYHDLLEILFFDVLNTPEKERKGGLPKLIAHYPFLNGGLFEAHESDYKDNFQLNIENEWFQTFFGNTLEKYNFTVDENSSSNAEIAIDPEMLGRIFENLLAEQNPETGESARKATGSFYTPREIVDYMVEQSISAFLRTSLQASAEINEAVEEFVHTQQLPPILEKFEKSMGDALAKIKVLDPACGSGAFPIGVLQKIVALKQQLHPKTKNYKLKLDTIQNSIYGVDIQPMAVELSRLRCWLSLVVDEEANDINALPNLDFKFVCADSLIDAPDDEYVKNLSAQHLADFTTAAEQYFNPDFKKKDALKKEIKICLSEIMKAHDIAIRQVLEQIRKEQKSATSNRLKQLNELLFDYSHKQSIWHTYVNIFSNKKVAFFNAQYFFPSAKKGFDVVIANPPYIQLSKDPNVEESYKTILKETYKTSGGRLNTFIFFIHRGISLLKPDGVLTYIIPNTILTQDYYKFTREQILKNNTLEKIVNYFNMPFENAVVENVTLIIKNTQSEEHPIEIYTDDLEKVELVATKSKSNFLSQNNFSFNINTNDIIESIFSKGYKTLENFCEVNQAIALKGDKSLSLKTSNPKQKYYRLLDGRNINKYSIRWDGVYLDYDLDRIHSCKRKDIFESSEKLMFRRVSENLIFTYDSEQYYALNTIIVVNRKTNAKINLKYLLAVLNSTLLNYLYRGKFKSTKKVFSEIQARSVEQLPIIEIANQQSLVILVDYILFINKIEKPLNEYVPNEHIVRRFEELIDACVYELYFTEEVKAKEAVVMELVNKQFAPIIGLPIAQQIEIVIKGYQLLRDSNNEINSRLTRQKLVEQIAQISGNTL